MALCVLCNRRPRPKDNSRLHCVPCTRALGEEQKEAEELRQQRLANSPSNYSRFWRVIHWKGELLGVIHPDGQPGDEADLGATVKVHYIRSVSSIRGIPKVKLIDLDVWQSGFDSKQVRGMKKSFYSMVPTFQVKKRVVDHAGNPVDGKPTIGNRKQGRQHRPKGGRVLCPA